MMLPYILLAIIWFALIAYATTGGADFGAGLWDLATHGTESPNERALINNALGPVWETNHVWLVFLVVGLFSAFPVPFSQIATILFIPLMLALIGVVLRGAAFVFRTHGLRERRLRIWTRIFSITSIITPLCLGFAAAAVASGHIQAAGSQPGQTDLGSLWLSPFALVIGIMAVSLCATEAAIYLTVEATNIRQRELAELYRQRSMISGAITAVLGALGLGLSSIYAPYLWHGMLNHAVGLVIATMLIGLVTAATVFLRYYRLARILIVCETAFLLGSWGVSQIPYLIPPSITVIGGAGSPGTLLLLLIGLIIGMAITLPSIYLLFYLVKLKSSVGFFERRE